MQYRHEIEHAPANFASAEGRTVVTMSSEAVWVYKWGTLSLASPRSGTNFKLRFTRFQ